MMTTRTYFCAFALLVGIVAAEEVTLRKGGINPAKAVAANVNVAIVYHSVSHHTAALAAAIAQGCEAAGATVRLLSVDEAQYERDVLQWADALILGSPTHYGNPSAAMLTWVESQWENYWTDPRSSSLVGGVFATGGGIAQGVEHVLASLTRLLWSFRFDVVSADPTRSGYASYGAIGITGTPPFNGTSLSPEFVEAAKSYGKKVSSHAAVRECLRTG